MISSAHPRPWRRFLSKRALALLAALLTVAATLGPVLILSHRNHVRKTRPALLDFDIRLTSDVAADPQSPGGAGPGPLHDVSVQWNATTHVPASLIKYGGYLTDPSSAPPEMIARTFLAQNAQLFRMSRQDIADFVVDPASLSPHDGVTHLVLNQ
jgi:hypothetical protein